MPRGKAIRSVKQVLREGQQRVTSQRVLLWDLLRQGKGHLDADELYRQARDRSPRISLSTVYRALRLFKELGMVEELHFDEGHHHYEGKAPREHYHLVCTSCGQVVEFTSPLVSRLKARVGQAQGFQVQVADIHLHGLCPSCQKKVQR